MSKSAADPAGGPVEVSAIVACDGDPARVPEALESVRRGCGGIAHEVLVVHGPQVSLPDSVRALATPVSAPSGLVPVLWGHGIATSRGRVVALTTSQFRARPGWAAALLNALEGDRVAGTGGKIALDADAGMLARAVYLLRYSEHIPSPSAPDPHDIAGENAAYVRAAVDAVVPDLTGGFWEVDVHRLMRARGERITTARDAVVDFVSAVSFGHMLENRFTHGGHFGAYRVRELGWPAWRAFAVTPLVPAVLFARMLRRVRRAGLPIGFALAALPVLAPLLLAWAAGEARGALSSARRTHDAA